MFAIYRGKTQAKRQFSCTSVSYDEIKQSARRRNVDLGLSVKLRNVLSLSNRETLVISSEISSVLVLQRILGSDSDVMNFLAFCLDRLLIQTGSIDPVLTPWKAWRGFKASTITWSFKNPSNRISCRASKSHSSSYSSMTLYPIGLKEAVSSQVVSYTPLVVQRRHLHHKQRWNS